MLNEGTDIPELNLVIIAKSYGENASGFKAMIQNIGRGTRPGTESLRIIDYSGFSRHLVDESHFVFAVGSREKDESSNGYTGGRSTLELNDVPIFVEDILKINFDSRPFKDRYPDFNYTIFRSKEGSLALLAEVAKNSLDIGLSSAFGPKNVLLKVAELSGANDRILDQIGAMSWTPSDGKTSIRGNVASQNRIFSGLHLVVDDFIKRKEIENIDISRIYEKEELAKFLIAAGISKDLLSSVHSRGKYSRVIVAHRLLSLNLRAY